MWRGRIAVALLGAGAMVMAGTVVAAPGPDALCRRVQSTASAWAHFDLARFERLIGPGFVHIDDHGRLMRKADWLRWARGFAHHTGHVDVLMRDILIRRLGSTAVVTTEDYIWHDDGRPPSAEHLRITTDWHRYGDGWKEVSYQATPLLSHVHCHMAASPIRCRVQVTVPPPLPVGARPVHGTAYVHVGRCREQDIARG